MDKSFITGSRAYGTPRPNSDFDLVVLVSHETLTQLCMAAWPCIACDCSGKNSRGGTCHPCGGDGYLAEPEPNEWLEGAIGVSDGRGEIPSGSFNFGKINMIAVVDEGMYEIWRAGTEFLKTKAPVTREIATKYLRKKRAKYNASRQG